MAEKIYVVKFNDKTKVIKEAEAIAEALKQEKSGVKPHYVFKGTDCPAGWLVWSSYTDGCGVVYRTKSGKMAVATGWQGDFDIIL